MDYFEFAKTNMQDQFTINWQCSQCHTGIVGPRPDECEYCGGLLEAVEIEPLMEIGAVK